MRLHFFNSAVTANSKMDYLVKKCRRKFTLPREMGRKKIDARISTIFLK